MGNRKGPDRKEQSAAYRATWNADAKNAAGGRFQIREIGLTIDRLAQRTCLSVTFGCPWARKAELVGHLLGCAGELSLLGLVVGEMFVREMNWDEVVWSPRFERRSGAMAEDAAVDFIRQIVAAIGVPQPDDLTVDHQFVVRVMEDGKLVWLREGTWLLEQARARGERCDADQLAGLAASVSAVGGDARRTSKAAAAFASAGA